MKSKNASMSQADEKTAEKVDKKKVIKTNKSIKK